MERVIDKHLYDRLKQNTAFLPAGEIYRAHVCEICLTIDILRISLPNTYHRCNPLWLIDYPELVSHKGLIKEYIRTHMPIYFARAIKEKVQHAPALVATEIRELELKTPERDVILQGKPELKPYFDMIDSYVAGPPKNPALDWTKPIELNVQPKSWADRAIRNRKTSLHDHELIEFITITGRTGAIFRVGNRSYLMIIIVSLPSL
jgi:hypothetical protein